MSVSEVCVGDLPDGAELFCSIDGQAIRVQRRGPEFFIAETDFNIPLDEVQRTRQEFELQVRTKSSRIKSKKK